MENRNHKDSLFIDLFCKDKEGKQNFISLYNALHNTNLDLATTTVQEVNIENVLYMALSNDIAMLVDNRLVGRPTKRLWKKKEPWLFVATTSTPLIS